MPANRIENEYPLYEDLEKFRTESKRKKCKRRLKFFTSMLKRPKDNGLKKRDSFVKKLLTVKRKPQEQEVEDDQDKCKDEASLQMLTELQKMIAGKNMPEVSNL